MTRLKFHQRLTLVSGLVLALLSHFTFGWLGFFTPFAKADAITWIGTPNIWGYWNDPTNWSGGVVPTASDDVIIAGDDIFVYVAPTTTINFSTLSLEGPDVRLLLYGNIGSGGDINVTQSLLFQANPSQQTISGDLIFDQGFFGTPPNTTTTAYGINFKAENITLGTDSEIDVHGTGFPGGPTSTSGYGNGGGGIGAGGGNAGYGGYSSDFNNGGNPTCEFLTYDADGPITPNYAGSGGGGSSSGAGGRGGGLVKLKANNTLTINGRIQAYGTNYQDVDAGGGAGGTVFLTAGTVTGTPQQFDVYGGAGSDPNGGGGSGGCVRVRYQNTSSLIGSDIDTHGGLGYQKGAVGLVMIEKTDSSDRRVFINATTTPAYGSGLLPETMYETADTSLSNIVNNFDDSINSLQMTSSSVVNIGGRALGITDQYPFANSTGGILVIDGAESQLGLKNQATVENIQIDSHYDTSGDVDRIVKKIDGKIASVNFASSTLNLSGYTTTTPIKFVDLRLYPGSVLTHAKNFATLTSMVNIQAKNITIDSGASVNVSGKGFSGGSGNDGKGPGGGVYTEYTAVGAGHGGDGTASGSGGTNSAGGGGAYCDPTNPATFGSGGSGGFNYMGSGVNGGSGGGLVWFAASSSIDLNGNIIANGGDGAYSMFINVEESYEFDSLSGAGAGGGVKLQAPTIRGGGTITANGGNNGVSHMFGEPTEYGGGGGGCVLVNYTLANSVTTSSISVAGGGLSTGVAEDGLIQSIKDNNPPNIFLHFLHPEFVNKVTDSSDLNGASGLQIVGNYAYVTNFLDNSFRIFDISSSTNPISVGGVKDNSALQGAGDFVIHGNYVFVGAYTSNSIQVIDISNPANPVIVNSLQFVTDAPEVFGIAQSGNYLYVVQGTDTYSSLRIINISNPLSLSVVGTVTNDELLTFPNSLTISGNYAYITTLANSLAAVDISNPAAPTIVGSVEDGGRIDHPTGVAVSGSYAYISGYDNGAITVVDVLDPENPEIVNVMYGAEPLISHLQGVKVVGNRAYSIMSSPNPGMAIYDVSDPLTGHLIGYTIDRAQLSSPSRMAIDGRFVYFTDFNNDSLNIFNLDTQEASANPTVEFDISDVDRETLSAKAEYKLGTCSLYSGTSYVTFNTSTATSTYGISINNSAGDNRRIQNVVIDPVSDFPVTQVTTTWNASVDVPGVEGEYCMFLTPYDGIAEGTRMASTLIVDDPLLAPSTPSLSTSEITETSITLSWAIVGGADHYMVSSTISGTVQETSDTSLTYAGLSSNTGYTFQIKSVDAYGNESVYSAPFTATTQEHYSSGGGSSPSTPASPTTTSTPETSTTSTPTSTPYNPSGLIRINHGDFYTQSRDVTITLDTTYTDFYMLSNTNDFTGKTFLPIVSSTTYTLTLGDGEKTIYARFKNDTGTYDAYDIIVLDSTSPPSPSFGSFSSELIFNEAKRTYIRKSVTSTTPLRPTLTGTAEPLSRVILTLASGVQATGIHLAAVQTFYTDTDSQGHWSFTFPSPLGNTAYSLSIAAEDAAGNDSSPTITYLDLSSNPPPQPVEEQPPVIPPEVPPEVPPETPPEVPPETPPTTPVDNTTQPTTDNTSNTHTTEEQPQTITQSISNSVQNATEAVTTFASNVIESLETIPAVKAVTEVAQVAITKTREVIDNPVVEQTNETIAVPIIAATAAVNVAVGGASLFSQVLVYIRLIFSQPLLLIKRRKQKSWGVVFNAYTKQPLDLATVRLVHGDTKQITRTQVTDVRGRYFIVANAGSYILEAQKDGYAQHKTTTTEDSVYPNLYHGEEVAVPDESQEINYNIPLEPVLEKRTNENVLKEYTRRALQKSGSLIGIIATVTSLIISPKLWITALLLLHLIIYRIMRKLAQKKIKGTYGTVTDVSHQKISKVVIRVFDAAYDKLVDTAVTDSKGKYAILVGPSTYYITAEKEGYAPVKSSVIDLSSEKTKGVGGVIAENITLLKLESENQPPVAPPEEKIRVRTMPLL